VASQLSFYFVRNKIEPDMSFIMPFSLHIMLLKEMNLFHFTGTDKD
jgi:hypothetical protein